MSYIINYQWIQISDDELKKSLPAGPALYAWTYVEASPRARPAAIIVGKGWTLVELSSTDCTPWMDSKDYFPTEEKPEGVLLFAKKILTSL